MDDLLKTEALEALFRVEASLRDERNHWYYGKTISSLLEQGLLVEVGTGLLITPKGKALLLVARHGESGN